MSASFMQWMVFTGSCFPLCSKIALLSAVFLLYIFCEIKSEKNNLQNYKLNLTWFSSWITTQSNLKSMWLRQVSSGDGSWNRKFFLFLQAIFSAIGVSGWKMLRDRTNSSKSITPLRFRSNRSNICTYYRMNMIYSLRDRRNMLIAEKVLICLKITNYW